MNIVIRKLIYGNKNLSIAVVLFAAAILVGVVAVFYNEFFLLGVSIARDRFNEHPQIIFLITPLFFLLSAWLCREFAPNAAGGGQGHVISAMKKLGTPEASGDGISEYLSLKIVIVKIVSSIVCIAGGGALGREGPVIQISASIFVLIAQKIKNILPSLDLRTWIVAGSAAGVAAAFNTPIAGIVFAIEELSQFHFEQKFSSFKTKAFLAVIVAGVTAQLMTGSYTLFEFPVMHFQWDLVMVLVLLSISCACGISAWLLETICAITAKWRNYLKGNFWYFTPVLCGIIVASVSYIVGINSFGAGMFTILDSIKSSTPVITYQETLGRFINVIATMSAGCAGGLLLPALTLGAGIGSIGGSFIPAIDTRIFVATGMAAFLGAMLNAPLTAAVLVLELTNQRELVFPMFLTTLAASWIFQMCNKSYAGIMKVNLSGH